MQNREYILSKTGQGQICVYIWEAEQPRAVLQIAHGMAEHMGRYDGLARYLVENGVSVIGHDMAGHGNSSAGGTRGYFGPGDGWTNLIEDLHSVEELALNMWPLPRILMGHSMGSFVVESYMARRGGADGYILSGTSGKNPALPFGRCIARIQMALGQGGKPSGLLNMLSFGLYNRQFRPNRTVFDWISRDSAEVDEYIADPDCGFMFTAEAFYQMFCGMGEIASNDWPGRTDDKPIFILSGDRDPVGGMGKGVVEIRDRLAGAGRNVEMKLYPGGRHELLHGPDKDSVRRDILDFVMKQVRP